ncbi:unnamed protein product, partial [Amoebophrya sp. A120]
ETCTGYNFNGACLIFVRQIPTKGMGQEQPDASWGDNELWTNLQLPTDQQLVLDDVHSWAMGRVADCMRKDTTVSPGDELSQCKPALADTNPVPNGDSATARRKWGGVPIGCSLETENFGYMYTRIENTESNFIKDINPDQAGDQPYYDAADNTCVSSHFQPVCKKKSLDGTNYGWRSKTREITRMNEHNGQACDTHHAVQECDADAKICTRRD